MKMKGVIFDFDDTLTDTSSSVAHAKETVFSAINKDYGVSRASYDSAIRMASVDLRSAGEKGVKNGDFYRVLADKIGVRFSETDVKKYSDLFEYDMIKNQKFAPGVDKVFNGLREIGVKIGILSDGDSGLSDGYKHRRLAELPVLRMADTVVIAKETIPESKNDPSSFKKTAEMMGLKPEEILSVGDRPDVDIDVAKTVGMKTALFTAYKTYPKGTGTSQPDYVISDLEKVLEILK